MTKGTFEDGLLNLVREFEDDNDHQHDMAAAVTTDHSYKQSPDHHTFRRRRSLTDALSTMVVAIKSGPARWSFSSVKTSSMDEDGDSLSVKLSSNKKINRRAKRVAFFSRLERTLRSKSFKTNKVLPH